MTAAIRLNVNPEAERAFLASLMRKPDMSLILDNKITPDHFAVASCREAFEAIAAYLANGTPPDAATLRAVLGDAALIETETSLKENASAANAHVYARLLKDAKLERDRQAIMAKIVAAAEGGNASDIGALLATLPATDEGGRPPPFKPFSESELGTARLSPKCIVDNYLYSDLAVVCAAGGTGKTTLLIFEAIHIALGRDLWGCRVMNPGKTLFVTAEDSRELFAARQREIMDAMNLSDGERRIVLESIAVWDVSGAMARLAELDQGGNIRLTGLADDIVDAYRDAGLVQIVFDPAISFGPGERLVNDGEQAVVTACRRIFRGLDCCVRLVHHTGKANARNGALDQYASRGGTALPDGCRMVTVLSPVSETAQNPPDGFRLLPGESGFVMARPKLSYCPPQPNVWIRRRGWTFDYFADVRRTTDETLARDSERLAEFVKDEALHGRKHTARTLDGLIDKIGLPRTRMRAALANLQVCGRIFERDFPDSERRGKRKTYLAVASHCAEPNGAIDEKNADFAAGESPAETNAPLRRPYREYKNGAIDAALDSRVSPNAPKHGGAITAHWRNSEDLAVELASSAGLDVRRMLDGDLSERDWERITTASAVLSERQPERAADVGNLLLDIDAACSRVTA